MKTVIVWNAETGKPILTHTDHVGWFVGMAFSLDSQRLASTGHVTETRHAIYRPAR